MDIVNYLKKEIKGVVCTFIVVPILCFVIIDVGYCVVLVIFVVITRSS